MRGNFWSDLREIYATLESNAGNESEASLLRDGNFRAMCRAARKFPMYVNEYFMMRAKQFMDEFARDALDLSIIGVALNLPRVAEQSIYIS